MSMKTENYKLISDKGEVNVRIESFPALQGLSLARRVLNIALPVFKMVDGKEVKKIKDVTKKLNISAIIDTFVETTETSKLETLIFDLCSRTDVGGIPMCNTTDFDQTFANNYDFLFEVVKKILTLSFESFFKIGGIGKKISEFKSNLKTMPSKEEK